MFTVAQKREIADKVQKILRETGHEELPAGEISFLLHVEGDAKWSWADIQNNGAIREGFGDYIPYNLLTDLREHVRKT